MDRTGKGTFCISGGSSFDSAAKLEGDEVAVAAEAGPDSSSAAEAAGHDSSFVAAEAGPSSAAEAGHDSSFAAAAGHDSSSSAAAGQHLTTAVGAVRPAAEAGRLVAAVKAVLVVVLLVLVGQLPTHILLQVRFDL